MATRPQQRSNLQPENVDDNDHGQGRDAARNESDGDGIDDNLTEEEMAQLGQMRTGERDADGAAEPAGDDGGGDDGEDGADGEDGMDADGDQGAAGDRDSGARDDRGQRQQDDGQQQRTPRTINYGRHQRELAKREQRLTELEGLLNTERAERQKATERATRLDERTKMLLDAINARPKAQEAAVEDTDPEPNEEEDPIAHASWTRRELKRTQERIARLEQGVTTDRQQREQETAEQREMRDYTGEIEAAAQRNPDFADAFVHLRETRFAELGAIYAGIDVNNPEECNTLSPEEQGALSRQIQSSFAQEQAMVYREAKRTGRSVEQTIMRLARARGFAPKQRQRADQDGDAGDQRRAQPDRGRRDAPRTVARQPQERRSVSEEIDNIRAAAGASKSLSDAGGSPGGDIDLKRLADMDDDEFMDIYNSIPKGKFDRLMGK